MMSVRTITSLVILFMGSILEQSIALADEAEARRLLTSRGLSSQGRFWICQNEVQLRKQIRRLTKSERAFFQARDHFDEFVGRYRRVKTNLEGYQAALDKVDARLGNDSLSASQRQQLEGESRKFAEQLKRMQTDLAEMLGKLDESSPLRKVAIGMVNARNELAILVLAIRRQRQALSPSYDSLRGARAISKALKGMGSNQQLGPMEDYQARLGRRLKRLSQAVFTDGVPVYLRGGQYRLSVILQERVPATFTYLGPRGLTMLPLSMLQAAEIEVDPTVQSVEVEVDDRKFRARPVLISELRIGRIVVRDVAALALPSEAEDLGARISLQALGSHKAALDPKSLWFRVSPGP